MLYRLVAEIGNARNGSLCGGRSAYSRPGGYEPKCYPSDVTPVEIEEYRISHGGFLMRPLLCSSPSTLGHTRYHRVAVVS